MQNVINNKLIIKIISLNFKDSPHNWILENFFSELQDCHLVLTYTLDFNTLQTCKELLYIIMTLLQRQMNDICQ